MNKVYNNISCYDIWFTGVVIGEQQSDCENAPKVENASSKWYSDDEGTYALATYTCADGFVMHGQAEVYCNVDTDLWQDKLPTCKPGNVSPIILYIIPSDEHDLRQFHLDSMNLSNKSE